MARSSPVALSDDMTLDVQRALSRPVARAAALGGLSLALAIAFYWPALTSYPATQLEDGPFFQQLVEATKWSLYRYHELPLWNPYRCGGVPLWDNPQSIAAAPLILLFLPLGSTAALRIWYVLHDAAAFAGMWMFARRELGSSQPAAFVAASIFAFNVSLANHFAGGHTAFVSFVYVPAAIVFWRRAQHDTRFAVAVGVLFAWMFYEGAVYPIPHVALILLIDALTRATSGRRVVAIGRAAAIAGVVFVCVGAARILPVVDQLRAHTRVLAVETEAIHWRTLLDMYLSRTRDLHGWSPEQAYVWGEYISYLGGLPLALALVGLLFARKRDLGLVVLTALVLLLMLGHFAAWAPWHLLKTHVFPYKSMRVPSRFRLVLLAFIAAWVAVAVDRLPAFVRKRWGTRTGARVRGVLLGVALLAAGDAMGFAQAILTPRFTGPPLQAVPASPRLYLGGPNLAPFVERPRQNRGPMACNDPWQDNEWNFGDGAALWPDDVPQARAEEPAITVRAAARTQNTFTVDVDAAGAGSILLNTPYERGWRTDIGEARDHAKLLEIAIPHAGRFRVHARYWPRGLTLGLWLSLLSLLGLAAAAYYGRRSPDS